MTEKKRRDWLIARCQNHPDWVLGFQDEVWFSRMAQPHLHAWSKEKPLPLIERAADASDREAKALACYGVFVPEMPQMYLRFVDGRPISDVTCQFLDWIAREMAAQQKTALLLIWDNASWHKSGIVKNWLKVHNRRVKREGGCRLLCCPLPSKSPWLNNIEPKWVHGKRAIAEPARKLTLSEIKERLCAYYRCEALEPLAQKVA